MTFDELIEEITKLLNKLADEDFIISIPLNGEENDDKETL